MSIRFIPNGALARTALPAREQDPRRDPTEGFARFFHERALPEALYDAGSPGFLFWQCREAALASLETWSALAGPLEHWQSGAEELLLRPSAGPGVQAAYDRAALAFPHCETPSGVRCTAASGDAVAHQVGHAILDALRPELWDSLYPETAAFHEAFADCMALLVPFFDPATCRALAQGGGARLRSAHPAEASAERGAGAAHPALNSLQWEIPIHLPRLAPAPQLSAEPRSFGRVFTGCFYDTVCNLFAEQPHADEHTLLKAAERAGRLLVAGARDAPEVPRFFQAVGRAMVLADEAANGGRSHRAIRDAFSAHGVPLGSASMLAPSCGLPGAMSARDDAASISAPARRDLLARIGAARGSRLRVVPARVGARTLAKAVHVREVLLTRVDRRLRGVLAPAAESVLVGSSAARAVVLGPLPDPGTTLDEVRHFASTLLEQGAIAFEPAPRRAARRPEPAELPLPTHSIRARGRKKMLTRVRFACRFS